MSTNLRKARADYTQRRNNPPPFMNTTWNDLGQPILWLNPHPAQYDVLMATERIVAMLGGTQVGKTVLTPHWLYREVKEKGAGDYLMVTATFPLLNLKMLPEFLKVFRDTYHLGEYSESKKVFTFDKRGEKMMWGEVQKQQTRIIFGSAVNPEQIESATAKAAVLDEAGQRQFRRGTWEAVLRRLSLAEGRILITTTLYQLGWLKLEVYDKWKAGDESVKVIQVDSIENPMFPLNEYRRAQATLPDWKFQMFYRGRYSQPAGLIYDSFDTANCVLDRFDIPKEWNCYVGHDFGGVNPAALFTAVEPTTGNLFRYREYRVTGKSAKEQVKELREISQGERIIKRVGGAPHEDGWRQAYSDAGWKIEKPFTKEVEVQIDSVYGLHKQNKIFVFRDMHDYLAEKTTFSRELDETTYEPTEDIEDEQKFHLMACERYSDSDFLRTPMADGSKVKARQKQY